MINVSAKQSKAPRRLLAELAMQDIKESLAKNFHIVTPNKIFRSSQPDRKEFISLELHGCKSVLNLRTSHSDLPKIAGLKLKEHRLKCHKITSSDIIKALIIIRDAEMPMLIHGCYGSDRTGVIVAAYRIVFENWDVLDAVEEFKDSVNGKHRYMYRKFPKLIKRTNWDEVKKAVFFSENQGEKSQEAIS